MSAEAQLRIGSLEILAALVVFGAIASRMRPYTGVSAGRAGGMRVRLSISERLGPNRTMRELTLALGDGFPAVALGRSSTAAVALADPEVSRRHAEFDVDRGVLYLTDLHSSNGTYLNGKRLGDEGIEVRPGDDIDVGNTRLTVVDTVQQTWT